MKTIKLILLVLLTGLFLSCEKDDNTCECQKNMYEWDFYIDDNYRIVDFKKELGSESVICQDEVEGQPMGNGVLFDIVCD